MERECKRCCEPTLPYVYLCELRRNLLIYSIKELENSTVDGGVARMLVSIRLNILRRRFKEAEANQDNCEARTYDALPKVD